MYDAHEFGARMGPLFLHVWKIYLARGGKARTAWERLQNTALSASRQSTTPEEWFSRWLRALSVTPTPPLSRRWLETRAGDPRSNRAFISSIEMQSAYVVAMAQILRDEEKERGHEDDAVDGDLSLDEPSGA